MRLYSDTNPSGIQLESLTEQRHAFVGSLLTGNGALEHFLNENAYTGASLNLGMFATLRQTIPMLTGKATVYDAITLHPSSRQFSETLKLPSEFTVPVLASFGAVSSMHRLQALSRNVSPEEARRQLELYWLSVGHGDN